MDLEHLKQLRACCRDQASFEQMQQILAIASASSAVDQQEALFRISARLRAGFELADVLQTTAIEVQRLLQVDRVGILQFAPDSDCCQGEFVTEAVMPPFRSLLALLLPDDRFGQNYAVYYRHGCIQAIADAETISPEDCHQAIHQQVRAYLAVPLLQGNLLWGMLCVHQCCVPRQWQPHEIQFGLQVATQIGIALQQTDLLKQLGQQSCKLSQAQVWMEQSQVQLLQNQQLTNLGALAAGVTQELQSPIEFINGHLCQTQHYIQTLLAGLARSQASVAETGLPNPLDPLELADLTADLPKTLAALQKGVDRIQQITTSLGGLYPNAATHLNSIDLNDSLDQILLLLQHRLSQSQATQIHVLKNYQDLPAVWGHASHIKQALLNVLNNAIESFADSAPDAFKQITLSTGLLPASPAPRLYLRIVDNGCGIPTHLHGQVFEPFFSTKPRASGLGLFFTSEIWIDRHGGSVQFQSEPGWGTEFCLELPLVSAPVSETPAQQRSANLPVWLPDLSVMNADRHENRSAEAMPPHSYSLNIR